MKFLSRTSHRLLALAGSVAALSGCQHVNVAQITYEVLRAEDCRRNQLEDFCGRTYASEYYDYVRLRQDFLRNQQQTRQQDTSDELFLNNVHHTL